MKTRLTLRPGQNGTKALSARFGERLVAVRYRYDETTRRRLKTVEIIIDEQAWTPPPQALLVHIRYEEFRLRRQVREAGGRWHPNRKLWILPASAVRALRLQERIIGPADED